MKSRGACMFEVHRGYTRRGRSRPSAVTISARALAATGSAWQPRGRRSPLARHLSLTHAGGQSARWGHLSATVPDVVLLTLGVWEAFTLSAYRNNRLFSPYKASGEHAREEYTAHLRSTADEAQKKLNETRALQSAELEMTQLRGSTPRAELQSPKLSYNLPS